MGTTKRKYASELYPPAGEYEVRPLSVEVPYLYAQAVGLETFDSDWLDVSRNNDRASAALTYQRIVSKIDAQRTALLADALLQGMTGDEAWQWGFERYSDDGEWVYERALLYGVPIKLIKPYPVLAEPDHHEHRSSTGDATGSGVLTRIQCPESECPACCEPETVNGGEDA